MKEALRWASSVSEAFVLENREAQNVVWCILRSVLGLHSTSPGVSSSQSCSPRDARTEPRHCLVGEKLLLSSEACWHHTWPGNVNGESWVLRVNHTSSFLLSLSHRSNREHSKIITAGESSWHPVGRGPHPAKYSTVPRTAPSPNWRIVQPKMSVVLGLRNFALEPVSSWMVSQVTSAFSAPMHFL